MLWEDTPVVTADHLREVMEVPLPEATALLAPVPAATVDPARPVTEAPAPAATDPPVPTAIEHVSVYDLTLVRR
jgi:hypothetical protein